MRQGSNFAEESQVSLTLQSPSRVASWTRIFTQAVLMIACDLATPVVGTLHAAVLTVGDDAGCSTNSLGLALLTAALQTEDDEIRLTDPVGLAEFVISSANSQVAGSVTLIGGFSSCSASTPTASTLIFGTTNGPIFTINQGSQVTLQNIGLLSATQSRALVVDGPTVDVTLKQVRVQNNDGGIEVLNGATLTADESSVVRNNNAGGDLGGGIRCSASTVDFAGSLLDNTALEGGAISVEDGCKFTLRAGALLANNTALTHGGAISASGVDSLITSPGTSGVNESSVLLTNNSADGGFGGGLYLLDNALAVLHDVRIEGNFAASRGAGVALYQGALMAMVRSGNSCSSPPCSRIDGNFISNSVGGTLGEDSGIAVYVEDGASAFLVQTTINNNSSADDRGNALVSYGVDSVLVLDGVEYTNNITEHLFYADQGGTFVAAHVTAAQNRYGLTGTDSKGGFAVAGSSLDIYSSILADQGSFTGFLPFTISVDCSILETISGVANSTRNTVQSFNGFLDPVSNFRLMPGSFARDYCDGSEWDPSNPGLDGNPRGVDDPAVPQTHGFNDAGAYESPVPIFQDGFEDGTTAAWG